MGVKSDTKTGGDIIDKIVAWFCELLRLSKYQKVLTQLTKFVIVGVITTLIDWIIYYVLCYLLAMNPILAQLFSFTISTFASFYMNILWVFDTTKGKTRRRLISEFFFFSACALGISTVLLYLFIYKCGLNDMLSKVLTTAVSMVFNYVTRKLFLEDRKVKPINH